MMKTSSATQKKSGVQAAKSENTQRVILKSAVECIFRLGYARASTKVIADHAKVSRGAMVHHFPSKSDLMEAVVEYLIEQRIKAFTTEVKKLKQEESRQQQGLDLYWDHLKSKYYTVYHELTVASRTDKELHKVMRNCTRELEESWEKTIMSLFPEWQGAAELFDLAMDLVQFSYEGMILNHLSHDDNSRRARVRNYIKIRVSELLASAKEGDLDAVLKDFVNKTRKG